MEISKSPEPNQLSKNVVGIAHLEMQMPTRLVRNHQDYPNIPWKNQPLAQIEERVDKRWDTWAYELYDQARDLFIKLTPDEQKEVQEIRDKKTKLFQNFSLKYYPVMRVLGEGKILGIDKVDEKGDLSWRIVSEHTLTAGKVAETLATAMVDKLLQAKNIDINHLSPEDLRKVKEQAVSEVVVGVLLQDITKRQEIEFKNLAKAEGGTEKQISEIQKLVNQGIGTQDDLKAVITDPKNHAFSTFERLLHQSIKNTFKTNKGVEKYGDISRIIACSKFSGMPVVDILATGYVPSLAEKIANYADKMVEHTALVGSLEQRHQAVRARYTPVEKVDAEYDYAGKCASKFAQDMNLTSDKAIPGYLLDTLFQQIINQPLK